MTNKDITKIYFRGNEIVALYRGSTLIFKKSGGGSTTKPTGVYTVRGTLKPDSTKQTIQLCVNGQREQFDVNNDKTFEYTFTNVPVTNMDYFTLQCKDELKTLDLSSLDTSQVTSMIELFYECGDLEEINLTNVNTSNVTKMTSMFYNCYNLTSLDVSNFDTSNVTSMDNMFSGCESLTSLDLTNFDTSKVTRLQYMFYNNGKLTDLYINFDVRLNTYFGTIFSLCFSLKNVVGKFEGTKFDLDLSHSPLTAASAMVFINGLATVTEKRTLALRATTYDSLTNEQIAIATAKGWTVTRN